MNFEGRNPKDFRNYHNSIELLKNLRKSNYLKIKSKQKMKVKLRFKIKRSSKYNRKC